MSVRGVEVQECERGVEVRVSEGCGGACVGGVWRCMCVRTVWTASSRDTGEDSVNTYCLYV